MTAVLISGDRIALPILKRRRDRNLETSMADAPEAGGEDPEEMPPPVEKMEILTPQQLSALNEAKVTIRMDNEQYLRDHPDVAKLMRALVRGIVRERPSNPNTFAYRFFSRDRDAIRRDLDSKE